MGTMGLVHSYIIEATDAFYLKEVGTVSKILEVKRKLRGGKLHQYSGIAGKPEDMAKRAPKISTGNDGGFKDRAMPAYVLPRYSH